MRRRRECRSRGLEGDLELDEESDVEPMSVGKRVETVRRQRGGGLSRELNSCTKVERSIPDSRKF